MYRRWLTLFLALTLTVSAGCTLRPQNSTPTPENSPPPASNPAPPPKLPPTPPQVTLAPAQVNQGDFTVIQLDKRVEGDLRIQVEGLWEQPKFHKLDGRPVALVGFPANAKTGAYPVTVTWQGGQWEGQIEVVKKAFTEDRLEVTQEQENVYNDPRQDAEWKRVFALRSESLPSPQWQGTFHPPLAGDLQITTYFGEIRIVNGKETGRHSGMDFAADTGTPILAPARGKVILAEPLIVSGKTVIIDHGFNLFTAYYHCDGLNVAPGDLVEVGQQIATVGNTGFSTGPHLHWTATIGNTPVDPWPLTQSPLLQAP